MSDALDVLDQVGRWKTSGKGVALATGHRQEIVERDGVGKDRIQPPGIFRQSLGRAAKRHYPCPDPKRPPRRKPRRATATRGAGEDEGMAVGVFVASVDFQ